MKKKLFEQFAAHIKHKRGSAFNYIVRKPKQFIIRLKVREREKEIKNENILLPREDLMVLGTVAFDFV